MALLVAGGCSGGASNDVVVLGAASLNRVFRSLEKAANDEGIAPVLSFAGSQTLVEQVRQGAPVDLIAVAERSKLDPLERAGRLTGEPVVFAHNHVVVVASPGSPVHQIRDLTKPGVRVVLAGRRVPAGIYARRGLRAVRLLEEVAPNVVATESDVTAVASRVALGEADAGVVYATDAAADRRLHVVGDPLPVDATYAAAIVRGSPNPDGARRFLRLLTSSAGRRALRAFGFTPVAAD